MDYQKLSTHITQLEDIGREEITRAGFIIKHYLLFMTLHI